MKILSYLLILCGLGILLGLHDSEPWIKLGGVSLILLFLVKIASLVWQIDEGLKPQSKLGFLVFTFLWPGITYQGFERRQSPPPETGRRFLESWLLQWVGWALLVVAAYIGR